MQDTVSVEQLNSIQRKVSIKVSANSVDQKFNSFFESVKGEVQIPGFRKGKAPVHLIKQHFSNRAKPSIAQMLISEFYTKAMKDYDFSPVGNPTIEGFTPGKDEYPGYFNFDNSYSVDLLVETLPDVNPVGYKDIELEFPERDLEGLVDSKLASYREQFAERSQVTDRPAQEGDSVVLDFTGRLKGEDGPFPGGSAEGFSIDKLGGGSLIPGFESQLVGMSVGDEATIDVVFPENYNAKHLAGKEAEFDVKIQSIVSTKLADVDEDLAMMVGYETVEELQENIKAEAEEQISTAERNALEAQVVDKLLESNSFDIPSSMVNFEVQRIIKQAQSRNQNLPENIADMLRPTAEKNVARAILIDAIYDKEDDIEVTPDELDEMLEKHAEKNNTSKDELVSMLYRSNQMDAFMGILRARKVIDYIAECARNNTEEKEDE